MSYSLTHREVGPLGSDKSRTMVVELKRSGDEYPSVTLHIAVRETANLEGAKVARALTIDVMHGHPDECAYTNVEVSA